MFLYSLNITTQILFHELHCFIVNSSFLRVYIGFEKPVQFMKDFIVDIAIKLDVN